MAWPKARDWSVRGGRLINRQSNGNEHSTTPKPNFTTMASNYNTTNTLEEIERQRAAMRAQREREDKETEQTAREAQMRAEEEHRREEQRRIGEQKRLAELQWVVAEDDDDEDEEDGDRQGAGPSVPKKRKYDDKVSGNRI